MDFHGGQLTDQRAFILCCQRGLTSVLMGTWKPGNQGGEEVSIDALAPIGYSFIGRPRFLHVCPFIYSLIYFIFIYL